MRRTILVSNRVPPPARPGSEPSAQAGGLSVVLRDGLERGSIWVGWSGRVVPHPENRPTVAVSRRVAHHTLDLSPEEHAGYYAGFANAVLWPAMHLMPRLMRFRRAEAETYARVNERFADAIAGLAQPSDRIWVHDYHLLLLPAALRSRGLTNPIGFFLHIPFPPLDVLETVPGADALVRGLLGADLIGLQTPRDAKNLIDAACTLAGAQPAGPGRVTSDGRAVRIGAYPVEIEPAAFAGLAAKAAASDPVRRLAASLAEAPLVLGVDRLDPTKGLPERLEAFERLLETQPEWRGRASMLQIAATSRQDVASYRTLRRQLESIAGRINAAYSEPHWTPVRLVTRAVRRETVAGYMRIARVGLVTPVRDGMNVVAKEFVAAQDPEHPGVLVLSRFAGAAGQLADAMLVNPHDPDEMSDALHTALSASLDARRGMWQRLWAQLGTCTARAWSRGFLTDLDAAASAREGRAAA
ncbi:MAG: trehalose-6-phosphate synthase [Proteobacteria bacterium]|nr:trehalose-6-phosphate synthase [Pseudomonadota bacterium]